MPAPPLLAVASLLVTLALAGCLGAVPTDAPSAGGASPPAAFDVSGAAAFEDAAGDAFEPGPRTVARSVACEASRDACAAFPEDALPDGAPAPHFDILDAAFEGEAEDHIVMSLRLAGLAEGAPELVGPGGAHRHASYSLCWTPASDFGERCAGLALAPGPKGVQAASHFNVRWAECNEWAYCLWEVPAEVEFGSPATVRFTIPKAYAAVDGAPAAFESVKASVAWWIPNPASPNWHEAFTVYGPDQHLHDHRGTGDMGDVADTAGPSALDATWTPAPDAAAPARVGPRAVSPPGALFGHGGAMDKPYLDLLAVDMREEGDELVLEFTSREFRALPEHSMHYMFLFGLEGKEVYEMGFLKEGIRAYGYAGHCISYECGGDFGGHSHDVEGHFVERLEYELTPGEPGVLTVRAPMSLFPTLAAGDRTNLMWAVAMYSEANVYYGQYGDAVHGDWHKMSFVDQRFGGAPYVFERGNPEAVAHDHAEH